MAISAGAVKEIDADANIDSADSERISDTQMIVAYNSTNTELAARVLDITTSTKTIDTVNSEQVIEDYGSAINSVALCRFSSTKFLCVTSANGDAQVLNVSGTTVTGGTSKALTSTTLASDARLRALTSTTALFTYNDGTSYKGRVLSIDGSDNISEGTELEIDSAFVSGDAFDIELYSPTKAIYCFGDRADNDYLKGQLITISGSTLSLDGSVQDINVTDSSDGTSVCIAAISSSRVMAGYGDLSSGQHACHIVILSGSTLSAGTKEEVASGQHLFPQRAVLSNETTILMGGSSGTFERITQIIKSGDTLTYTTSDFVSIANNGALNRVSLTKIADDYALNVHESSLDGAIIESSSSVVFSGYDLVLGGGQS